jgi:hypothetical protein
MTDTHRAPPPSLHDAAPLPSISVAKQASGLEELAVLVDRAEPWACRCGSLNGPSLVVCPSCSLSKYDTPAAILVACQGCGHKDSAAVDPGPFTKCSECQQRTAHGRLIGRWVVHPLPPDHLELIVTRGLERHTFVLDLLYAAALARDILSISLPEVV